MVIFKIIPPPNTYLTIFCFFYPLSVKLMWNVIQQNWSVMIQALKINQGTKFGTPYKPMFSLFDAIIFFIYWDNKTKYLGHNFQWAIFQIIASLE